MFVVLDEEELEKCRTEVEKVCPELGESMLEESKEEGEETSWRQAEILYLADAVDRLH
jgi:hypothetical protein